MNILVIIPARGGSKGIKDKNIIDICGKPLIHYSIASALELKNANLVSKVIVSTDSEKIKNIALEHGAEVPFLRPDSISGDKAKSIDFILHAVEFYEKQNVFYDAVLLLQPTSPLRSFGILQNAVSLFSNNNADSLISCYEEEYINDLVMYKVSDDEKSELMPLNSNHNKGVRRQDHGAVYVRNGSVYLTRVDYLKNTKQIISDNPTLIEMKKSHSINLDTIEDVDLLRSYLCK